MKDLTDFFHQGKAEILRCAECSLLVRRELEQPPAPTYSDDEYNPSVMNSQYPRYLNAFRAKEQPYRAMLPAGAQTLEVGSHYGAFLQTAAEWGWHIEGVDIGKDSSRFARSKGFTVHTCELRDCRFPPAELDGVFVWNCFEQLADPRPLLEECRRILKPAGLLVLRTPNGVFYELCERLLRHGSLEPEAKAFLIDAMGYNNMLGFPYLYGHSAETLARLAGPFGFRRAGMLNSELITLPLPEDPGWVEQEERTISEEVKLLAGSILASEELLTGPWIEVWFHSVNCS